MTSLEVANRYSELAKLGKWLEIQQELYDDDIITIEPPNSKNPEPARGKETAIKKNLAFIDKIEQVHSSYLSEPIIAGDNFSIALGMDVTWKNKTREKFDETAVFDVKGGKIIKEQFFMTWT